MKILLTYLGRDHVFDVTDEQFLTLRRKIGTYLSELKAAGKTLPTFSLSNLDTPTRFTSRTGAVFTSKSATTTTFADALNGL